MKIAGILFVIAIIILIYLIIRYLFKQTVALTGLLNGQTSTQISAATLSNNPNINANANNFAYSIWFYIQDWNYRYGEQKIIFGRMSNPYTSAPSELVASSGKDPSPVVFLDGLENNIIIALGCYPGANQVPENNSSNNLGNNMGSPIVTSNATVDFCKVNNVPIQRWVNLLISVYGRTLDVYMDGKLVKTCLLPGVAMVNTSADLYLTPAGGFNGWTSKLQYFPNPINPQQAWNIYTKGYGTSIFNNNYQIKVSFDENGQTKSYFTI